MSFEEMRSLTDVIIPARAMENCMWVIYCNRTGEENQFFFSGRSTAADAEGRIALQLGGKKSESGVVRVELTGVEEANRRHPFLADLRPCIF